MYVITMVLLVGNYFSPQCLFKSWNIKIMLLYGATCITYTALFINDILLTRCTLFVCKYLMLLVHFPPDKI